MMTSTTAAAGVAGGGDVVEEEIPDMGAVYILLGESNITPNTNFVISQIHFQCA